ncbi:NAD(P)-dependent oxidoreductase [Pedobacter panaciterrae]|jgi:putative NADH-flavin reductase|uniref:NAD(P)-dependent oxidoreductase n=1 Tax=Pedobacter panaciterrae TaxID=363849 RepID=A0ABU8NPY7_9SPHI|nr:NAD(P)-dependent oxidoreductase [Pedobacter panaciterrae]NQX54609.1 NAD(P)-dependent oxidoreductase [Pedobacter panaciterrae]
MKTALIGASGFVGTAILEELLNRGHEVTAIVRSPEKIKIDNNNLFVKGVDVNDTLALIETLKGSDAVISAYNSGWTNPNLYHDFIAGSEAIQKAVKASGVDRLIVVGGAGSLEIDGKQLVDGPDFPADYKAGATAARDYLTSLKQEEYLQWSFFSPAIEMHPGITTGRTGKYRLGTNSPVFNEDGRSTLSVQDLAMAIVDELENNKHPRQRFTAGY